MSFSQSFSVTELSENRSWACAALVSLMLLMLLACTKHQGVENAGPAVRPKLNVLIIVADDIGPNDLGYSGSEIRTPNIDALAGSAVVFTNFYATPTCSTTRASLLTGVDHHRTGLGSMAELMSDNQRGHLGYEGHLNFHVSTLAELFDAAGYDTFMSGKWHLGTTSETGPNARGFDRSFALMTGGAGSFANMLPTIGPGRALYTEDGEIVETLPDDFYASDYYVDRLISYLEGSTDANTPFFAYLAFTAAHWPLQARQETIAGYDGVYDSGYEVLAANRLAAAKELGHVSADVPLRPFGAEAWSALSRVEQQQQARKMQVYAAMIEDMDTAIGQLITHLEEQGKLDNTIIVFLSDNGPEGHDLSVTHPHMSSWSEICCNNSLDNIGNADSYIWIGPNWTRASNTPFRLFKGYTDEGGIRVPAFIRYPAEFSVNMHQNAVAIVQDIAPTLLDIAEVDYEPKARNTGRQIFGIDGRSLVSVLSGDESQVRSRDEHIAWELFGKRALRQGSWKIVYIPSHSDRDETLPEGVVPGVWQLYNLAEDPGEMHDLSTLYEERTESMVRLWEEYAANYGVILPETIGPY